jgi:hypothetical protein
MKDRVLIIGDGIIGGFNSTSFDDSFVHKVLNEMDVDTLNLGLTVFHFLEYLKFHEWVLIR